MAVRSHSWHQLSWQTKAFVGLIVIAGTAVLIFGAANPVSKNISEFICYLLIALLAARLKVNLPGIAGTMSVNFLFVLVGILELSISETLVLACVPVVVQCIYRPRPTATQMTFNICASALATAVTYSIYHNARLEMLIESSALLLGLSAVVYFLANTLPTATVIALSDEKSFQEIWSKSYFWSFPYYLVGAASAGSIAWFNQRFNWETSLLIAPVVYVIHESYRLYLEKLDDEKRHVGEMANLHLRTIEALALAIEAKDHTTHDHLQRVRVYAIEVAKEIGVAEDELEALNAAALLHDIGKLAVPEHIISKPGRLTPEEFEKMKIHPVVGAEILERVRFPYPVVPIVRAHHEKWDGSGYPFGLRGTEIPIGARILSAVDFLDALASDRQYRRALPLDDVMKRLGQEAGKSFDPKVVEVLRRRYRQLEAKVRAQVGGDAESQLSTDVKVERGSAPAAGFEDIAPREKESGGQEAHFLSSIAAARQEAQTLFELSHDLGASLSLGETLSVLSMKLRRLVPYDSIAIYVRYENELVPEYVSGDNFRMLSSLRIPVGGGLSGWVAHNKKPIVNGNPSVEPGYESDPAKHSALRSALSIPLEGLAGVVGVLTLYHSEKDAFTSDHLRILLAISSKMALAIENALKYERAESSATTDYLTELPNARSLFLQLDRELARCKRDDQSLTVMVCDMDGFKQINDRFGHLEGNRVLRLFAQSLKESCREYDYVARMGGDEFVVIAPGLPQEAADKRATAIKNLAMQAGLRICGEDILSLSVGQAIYPNDGQDAEALLAEADRRMYLQKQQQPAKKNRRLYPRMKGRVTIELQAKDGESPIFGNLNDVSLGGCYVETSAIISRGQRLKIAFSMADGKQSVEGFVARLDPGIGVAIQFSEINRADREKMYRILEFVQSSTAVYMTDNPYMKRLQKR